MGTTERARARVLETRGQPIALARVDGDAAATWIFRGDESHARRYLLVTKLEPDHFFQPYYRSLPTDTSNFPCQPGRKSKRAAAPPRLRFRGGESRRRRGCHVDIPRRRVAAPPRLPRRYSAEMGRGAAAATT